MELLLGKILDLLLPAILAAIIGGKGIKFVHEGELGIRLRFGKATRKKGVPKVIQPGFVLLIPFVESLKRRHVRQQTHRFTEQEIFIEDDLVFVVSAIVRYRVTDIYKALFEVDDLDECITDKCMGLLRDVLQKKSHAQLRDSETISRELLGLMQELEQEWGVKFLDARMTSCAPTSNSAHILSVRTSANMKAKAVKDAVQKLEIPAEKAPGLYAAIVGVPIATTVSHDEGGRNGNTHDSDGVNGEDEHTHKIKIGG